MKNKKEVKPPTAIEMQEFANQFSKSTWEKLCKNKRFMKLVDSDLKKCEEYTQEFIKKFGIDENK